MILFTYASVKTYIVPNLFETRSMYSVSLDWFLSDCLWLFITKVADAVALFPQRNDFPITNTKS